MGGHKSVRGGYNVACAVECLNIAHSYHPHTTRLNLFRLYVKPFQLIQFLSTQQTREKACNHQQCCYVIINWNLLHWSY